MTTYGFRQQLHSQNFGGLPNAFEKLLVANRGEIAVRIFRTAHELGLRTVAVYSSQDRLSRHRFEADEAYEIKTCSTGGTESGSAVGDYLNISAIINIAKNVGAAAIHPGYGFLAENAEFVKACHSSGITFVGPSNSVISLFGDKLSARGLAVDCGVPVAAGTLEPIQTEQEMHARVKEIGLPIAIKAVFGGGGKGIRFVRKLEELSDAYNRCVSEAKAAFGSGEVFVEKLIESPRHIEIQLLGDKNGNMIHLYERDCSIQVNNQKFVEIAPCPSLSSELRQRLVDAALKIGKRCDYFNAGTVEFLVSSDGNFFFGEVNPRIQVEHTVTEQITGIDIVQQQLLIAAGATLSQLNLNQDQIHPRGYAIQCRINSAGISKGAQVITEYREFAGNGVRVDSCAYSGYVISPHYDALIAKVTTNALRFEHAVVKAAQAVTKFKIRGVQTNTDQLLAVLTHPDFIKNNISTKFVDSLQAAQDSERSSKMIYLLLRFLADAWANGIKGSQHKQLLTEVSQFGVSVESGPYQSGQEIIIDIREGVKVYVKFCAIGERSKKSTRDVFLELNGQPQKIEVNDESQDMSSLTKHPGAIISEIGGVVVEVKVKVGDIVKIGDVVAVITVMKMEHVIKTLVEGRVEKILIEKGDLVSTGDAIVIVEAERKDSASTEVQQGGELAMNRIKKVVKHLNETDLDVDSAVWAKDINEMRFREELAYQMGGDRGIERQRKHGKLTVRERIALLMDDGSFDEIGSMAGRAEYDEDGKIISFSPANFVGGQGVITVGPQKIRIMVGGDDFTVRGGHADGSIAGKQVYLEMTARQMRLPMVRLLDGSSGGGSVANYLKTRATYCPRNPGFEIESRMLGEVPCVAALLGPVVGLAAGRAVLTHFAVTVQKVAQLFVAGPPVVMWATHENLSKEELGGIQIHGANGSYDNIASSEIDAINQVKQFLSYLPANAWEIAPRVEPQDDPERKEEKLLSIIPRNRASGYDIRELIQLIVDKDSWFEIGKSWGGASVVGFARMNGYTIGVISNDNQVTGGCLTAMGSQKMRRHVDLCDNFHIPIIGFIDNPGFAVGLEEEKRSCIRHGGNLIASLYGATVPWYTVILRRVFGVGGAALVARSDLNERCAWPSADWGSLPLEGGIEAAYKRRLLESDEPDKLRKELLDMFEEIRSPLRTAEIFGIEKMIDPRITRPLLCDWIGTAYRRLGHGDQIKPKYSYRP